MGYGITSRDQIIDISEIKKKIGILRLYVGDFGDAIDHVENAGEICTSEALLIDGVAYINQTLINLAEEMHQQKQAFMAYLDSLEEETQNVYDAQVAELNNYIAEQEANRRRQEAIKQQQQQQESLNKTR